MAAKPSGVSDEARMESTRAVRFLAYGCHSELQVTCVPRAMSLQTCGQNQTHKRTSEEPAHNPWLGCSPPFGPVQPASQTRRSKQKDERGSRPAHLSLVGGGRGEERGDGAEGQLGLQRQALELGLVGVDLGHARLHEWCVCGGASRQQRVGANAGGWDAAPCFQHGRGARCVVA